MTPSTPDKPRVRVYRCPKCTVGYVVPTSRDGRFFDYKEVVINLPMSVYVPTCGECGAEFTSPELDAEIKQALEKEYKRHEADIVKALERLRRRRGNN